VYPNLTQLRNSIFRVPIKSILHNYGFWYIWIFDPPTHTYGGTILQRQAAQPEHFDSMTQATWLLWWRQKDWKSPVKMKEHLSNQCLIARPASRLCLWPMANQLTSIWIILNSWWWWMGSATIQIRRTTVMLVASGLFCQSAYWIIVKQVEALLTCTTYTVLRFHHCEQGNVNFVMGWIV
jgi:hypothetical protein